MDSEELTHFDPLLWIDGEGQRQKGYTTSVLTDRALQFIDRDDGRPFFLWLAYSTPHDPLALPPDLKPPRPDEMALPPSIVDDLHEKPRAQRESEEYRLFKERDLENIRRSRAVYQAMVDALDRDIGRLLEHVRLRWTEEKTLVVFLSDNGVLRGEHEMLTKGPAFYEELVRTPLLVNWPGVVRAGTEVTGLVGTIDLFPTLARVAGAETPPDLDGKDLWPLLSGSRSELHDELYFEYARKTRYGAPTPMLGLATERYKYVHYLDTDEEELYDLERDPFELENLANSPSDVLADLRQRLVPFAQEGARARALATRR